jgi:hypothetical protein
MALKKIETHLPDAAGTLHLYQGTTMPTEHLINLALDLADVAEGPIASLLRGLVGGEVPDEVLDAEIDLKSGKGILAGLKLEGIFSRAAARGGAKLARRMLYGLTREADKGTFEDVGESAGFDAAYSANLPELVAALRWVFQVNVLPFSPASGASGNEH